MPAYLIADTYITDATLYEDYKRQVPATIKRFGGRYLTRGGNHEVLEGDWHPHRIVMIEFDDMSALKAWYNSSEYQALLALRQNASSNTLIAINGT